MSTTRAATFSAKIKTLSEFHTRISSNQQIPSNAEVITTLRYFQQTLISFLKDVPKEKYYILKKYASDISRQSVFPNLNYSGLFYGLINLLDVFTQIPSGHQAIGEAILDVFRPLYLFLERENLDQLPYAISSQLGVFPDELAKKLMHVLCDCIMPYLLTDDGAGEPNVPILLLMVLQYNKNRSLHTMALESLMRLKSNIYADVISVIAKGSSESRITAANLLFHYWPINNPTILHRKQIQYRVQAWSPVKCQNLNCSDKAPSIKVCYNPTVSAKYGDLSPPIFLCKSCASDIQTDVPMKFIQQPMPAANTTICQNKGCESSNRMAVGTCFDEDCIRSHSFVPLRLCQECITCLHENQQKTHKKHTSITNIWGSDYEFIMIEAIVKLLKETSYQLESTEGDVKRPKWLRQLEAGQTIGTDVDTMSDERKMLSRFGIWIMAALCPPTKEASKESVGYILAMLFQWFTTTALLPNDSMGSQLEQLKVDFVSDWVHMAITHHYDVFIQILSPILPEYGKVGGAWDKMCNKKEQMKEGLSKLLALMPYDIINLESWNTLMPLWLQAISQEIGDEDINDLKVLLCKIFEPDLCPLPFEIEKVYGFISSRLAHGDKDDILNALQWVHLLSRMDIAISMHMLLDMLTACVQQLVKCKYFIKQGSELEGINELQEIENSDDLDDAEPFVSPLVSQVIITDILMQQMELNEITNENAKKISDKLFCMAAMLLDYPTCDINDADGTVKNGHTCQNPDTDQFADCSLCQETVFFYQILVTLTSKIAPLRELDICTVEIEAYPANDQLLTESFNKNSKTSSVFSPQSHETNALNASMVSNVSNALNQANILTPHSGTSEFASVLPSDVIEPSNAQPFSIVEEQFSNAVIRTETAQIIDDLKTSTVSDPCPAEDDYANKEFWDTSVGKFKFKLSALPAELQLIFNLLKNIDREINPDVQYYLLKTLNYLCLHCEALVNSRRDQRGFLIWLQENLLIPKLYQLLRSDYSQVGQISVKLLIHAVTLPYGEEIFWNIVNNDYINDDWKVRFKAVERVFVLAHLVSPSPIRSSKILQTTLSCAFCHLIVSANDPNTAVSQRAILSIQALPATCLQIIGLCLESQFDSCILDRPLIVQRFQLLTQLVPDESFLTWDFFIQRFETLALESQLKNQGEETTYVQDFLHTDPSSDLYQKKLNKARKSLHEAENVRSIVKSLRENSLRHQLSNIVKQEEVKRQEAANAANRRGRRSAILTGALGTTARFKLKKVLMYVRVVGAFKKVGDSLSATNFFNNNLFSRRSTSPMPVPEEGMTPSSSLINANNVNTSNTIQTTNNILNNVDDRKKSTSAIRSNSFFGFDDTDVDRKSEYDPLENSPGSKGNGSDNLSTGKGGGKKKTYGERLREFTDEESNLCLLLNRVVDIQNPERHTVYLIISLFCDFLCSKKMTSDEKSSAKKQSMLLRHFNTLLGYSHSEKCFTVPPARLRKSVVCNSFLSGLPEILDCNLLIGNQMLLIIVQLLLHLPSPQEMASDASNAQYSIALLSPLVRQEWLNTLILILYKYRFDNPPVSDIVLKLISIVISTIDLQCHSCSSERPNNDPIIDWSDYSDDSGVSDADEGNNIIGTDTIMEEAEDGSCSYSYDAHHKTSKVSVVIEPSPNERYSLSRPSSLTGIAAKSKEGLTMDDKIESIKNRPPNYKKKKELHKRIKKSKSIVTEKSKDELAEFRCGNCNEILKNFDEESLSLCIIALETFSQREPTMAAPILFRIITSVSKFIETPLYPWHESTLFVPGNSRSTAKQLLRVIFHQLSNCGIAYQLFDSKIEGPLSFWTTISFSLTDFHELNPISLIHFLLEDVLNDWPPNNRLARILFNLAAYIQTVPNDLYLNTWSNAVTQMDIFFRRYYQSINLATEGTGGKISSELKCSIIIMKKVMKVQNFSTFKCAALLVEGYSKWLAEALHHAKIDLIDLLGICTACNRALIRERDKQYITRAVVTELIQAIKFKVQLHNDNYMKIVDLILQDTGELVSVEITDDQYNTGASDAVKPYINDILEFVSDYHVLSRLKKQTNNDSVGGDLKAGLAKIVAVEMSRTSGKDNRPVTRYIPWLLNPPNITQAAPGAFAESVTNVRIVSWLLLGALHSKANCLPIPIENSNHIADYIHFVLVGFADQSSQSITTMSGLFHAAHLCQIWTVYCEQRAITCNASDLSNKTMNHILEFWSRVTPAILQLLSHSKVLADMVNLHFVNTLQALQQVNSAVLCQLYPMWQPMLTAYHHAQIPSQLRKKLEACENQPSLKMHNILDWVKQVRYKIGQIELQTSAASPFYNV